MPEDPREAVVVVPGAGHVVGNVEFLARTRDTPRFNLSIITLEAGADGPPVHEHTDEDDAFYILSGELHMEAGTRSIVAVPGTFVLIPPGVRHTFANRTGEEVRFLNIHAPAGFDLRLEEPDH